MSINENSVKSERTIDIVLNESKVQHRLIIVIYSLHFHSFIIVLHYVLVAILYHFKHCI